MKYVLAIIVAVAGVGTLSYFWFSTTNIDPLADTTMPGIQNDAALTQKTEAQTGSGRMIYDTKGVRHSVPLEEILSGGPPKDGIPSIDNPKFQSITNAEEFLSDDERGVIISMAGVNRFYPFQILVWHEIVNDTVNGERILVTYCPLCGSAIVFDPIVEGEAVEFGVSGRLWQSNLLMYDRKTDSLWSQAIGEAVLGSQTGTLLDILEYDIVQFGDWKTQFPDGEVLSRATGARRFYGDDPYGNYYTSEDLFFPVNFEDDRLERKAFVLGITVDNESAAFLHEAVRREGIIQTTLGGQTIVAEYNAELDTTRLFRIDPDGTRERINPFSTFWFAWVATHPDTALFN